MPDEPQPKPIRRQVFRPAIQPVSRTPKPPVKEVKDLECFDEVDRRLRLGNTIASVVKYICEEQNEMTHLKESSVTRLVKEYRDSIPAHELLLTSQGNNPSTRKIAENFNNGLEELNKLEELWALQMSRIEIDVANERKINKLLPNTGREVFYATKIVKQISELKMDLGIAKRQLGEMTLTGQSAVAVDARYGGGVGKVLTDPGSRRKVMGMVEALLSVAAKGNIDAAEIIQSAVDVSGAKVIEMEEVIDDSDLPPKTEGE